MNCSRHRNDCAKKARRSGSKNHLKGPHKRSAEDDLRFEESFERLLCKAMSIEEK